MFFVNIPVGIVVLLLARRLLPAADRRPRRHRLDVLGAALLGGATFCVLFAAVEYDALRDARLALAGRPGRSSCSVLFLRRERRLTPRRGTRSVDLRLFRRPSYVSGITLALTFFPAMAGLPLVLALYYQHGLGYTALESALGMTAYAVGSAVSRAARRSGGHPRSGGQLVVGRGRDLRARRGRDGGRGRARPDGHATLALAAPCS